MRLSLFYPVKPFHINQHFGDNIPCVQNFGASNQIIENGADNNTCPAGFSKLYPCFGMSGHNGTDLEAGVQPVFAAYSGIVIEQQTVPARGLGLGILSDEQVDLDNVSVPFFVKLRYWHLKSFIANVGDHVNAGDLIAISNNTGYSGGNHLHFELDPMIKDSGGHPQYASLGNEWYNQKVIASSISLEPYFNGQYAQDVPRSSAEQLRVLAYQYIASGNVKTGNIILAVSKIVAEWQPSLKTQ